MSVTCYSLLLCVLVAAEGGVPRGILYPQQSETREINSLDGIWQFSVSPTFEQDIGFKEKWYRKDLKKYLRKSAR